MSLCNSIAWWAAPSIAAIHICDFICYCMMWLKKHKNWKPHTDSFWQKSSLQYKKCFKSFLQASWSILIQMVWTYKKVQQHYQLQKRCRKHANYSECKNIFFYYTLVKVFQSFTLRILTSMQAARSSRGCQHTPTLIKFLAFRQGRNLFEKLSVFCLQEEQPFGYLHHVDCFVV